MDDEDAAAIEGGQLAPLLGSRSAGSPSPDASLLRRLYAGHGLARWGARCVHSVISYVRSFRTSSRVFQISACSFFLFFCQLVVVRLSCHFFFRWQIKDVGVLGWAVHDPHLARLAALHGDLRRRRVLLRRRVWSHSWDTGR